MRHNVKSAILVIVALSHNTNIPFPTHSMKYIISLGVILGAYQFGKYTQSDTAAWLGVVAFLGLVMVVACKAILTSIIAKMPHA